MKKFSKILEGKDKFFSDLNTSESEIKDICSDLIDDGYKCVISEEYISKNGKIYYIPNQAGEYYPAIVIKLYRSTNIEDENGEAIQRLKNDVRNWNGGIYYENDINLLKVLYEMIYRFESMFTSEKAEVFYSIRSLNDITIRITFNIDKSDSIIDVESVINFIENYNGYTIDGEDDYKHQNIWSSVHNRTFEIDPKVSSWRINSLNLENPQTRFDRIIYKAINSKLKDNSDDLRYCLKKYVDDLYSLCKKRDSKLVLNSSNLSGDPRYSISINGEDLIIIRSETEEIGSSNIKIPKKGIFKKDDQVHITIYKMEVSIKITNED